MEPVAGGSVLEALYREASTRRHTADRTQARLAVVGASSSKYDSQLELTKYCPCWLAG